MKNFTLLLIFLGGFLFNSNAQRPEYDDLNQYFAAEQYDKLLKKAYKYTQGDKTKKDPLPYYYLSIANYKISKGHELLEKYPRALKESFKFAGKCIQKDKDSTVVVEKMEHFTNLKVTITEEIRNLVELEDFGRMNGKIPLVQKIDKKDVGATLLKAIAYYYKKDRSNFKKFGTMGENLLKNASPDKYSIDEENDDYFTIERKKSDLELLKIGVIEYCKVLVVSRQEDKAKDLMGKLKQWYPEDKEFKAAYDEIVN